jgi:hypothetical protein
MDIPEQLFYSCSRIRTPANGGFGNGAGRLEGSGGDSGIDNRCFVFRDLGNSSGAGIDNLFGGLEFKLLLADFSFS